MRRTNGAVTMVLVAVVAVAAAGFARLFRASVLWVAHRVTTDHGGQLDAARALGRTADGVIVAGGIIAAASIARLVRRRYDGAVGLRALAAAAHGDREPSNAGTALRTGATWIASASLSSIGREAAIVEAGAMIGSATGRVTRRPTNRLAMTGVAAAFAVAYHAPLTALLFVEHHLGMRRDRRSLAHVVAGSTIGFFVARWWFGGETIFPKGSDPLSWSAALLTAIVVLPAYLASRLFFEVREWLGRHHDRTRHVWWWTGMLAAIGGVTIAIAPMAVGNGMEALRSSATSATVGIAMTLLVAKLVATAVTVGAGVPGGAMSPSLAVAGGAALAMLLLLDGLGVELSGAQWDATLIAMSIGVAVSIEAPLVALLMVPEMAGDLRLVPCTVAAVGVAVLLDRVVDGPVALLRVRLRQSSQAPLVLRDDSV